MLLYVICLSTGHSGDGRRLRNLNVKGISGPASRLFVAWIGVATNNDLKALFARIAQRAAFDDLGNQLFGGLKLAFSLAWCAIV
jgi:hypothetical protein